MKAAIRNPKSAIFLLALIIRLAWVLHLPSDKSVLWQLPDQVEYYKIAQNLLIGKGLHFWDDRFDGDIHAFRMPGYPLFVAACGGKIVVVRIVQALIDTSTVLAAYLLAKRWMNDRSALLSAGLVAVNPFLIYFSGLMLSETLFVAMLAWGMYLLVRSVTPMEGITPSPGPPGEDWGEGSYSNERSVNPRQNPHPDPLPRVHGRGGNVLGASALWALLLLALSIHIRPSAMLLPIFLPLVLCRNWKLPIIGAAMSVLVLLPWAIRNKHLLGEWIWTTTNSGVTLYDGFNPDATGASNQNFLQQMPQLKEMSEIGRSRYLSSLAQNYLATSLPRVVSLTFNKIARTWSPIPLSDQFGSRKLYRLVGGGYATALFGLAIIGFFRGNLPKNVKLFLLLPAVYFTLVHAMSVGSLRYRLPAEAPLAVLAGAVLTVEKKQTADRRLPIAD